MAEAPILAMFTTLQEMTHYVRTVYGDLDIHIGGEENLGCSHPTGSDKGMGQARLFGW